MGGNPRNSENGGGKDKGMLREKSVIPGLQHRWEVLEDCVEYVSELSQSGVRKPSTIV
jgi:hypothetical protein